MIFTFWEGHMPAYIKLCMKTWKFDYVLLNYANLNKYTCLDVVKLQKFTLPQIADIIRVHVLRDNGGYWLDADTIMFDNNLPTENMIGNPTQRTNSIGYLHTEKNSEMFTEWAKFQDNIICTKTTPFAWNVVGNAFTDNYVKEHEEITIADIEKCWAETYMIKDKISRYLKYQEFYFLSNYYLKDLQATSMLMLHNSWTPHWYKQLNEQEILQQKCTLSNILKETL